jgi:hypothetical protein
LSEEEIASFATNAGGSGVGNPAVGVANGTSNASAELGEVICWGGGDAGSTGCGRSRAGEAW